MLSGDAAALVPFSQLTPSPSTTATGTSEGSAEQNAVRKQHAKGRFRYGNYNRYYGVRNQGFDHDPRVDLLPAEWFRTRRVLDIGCNAGHLTLEVAKKLGPAHILGIDIDEHLVGVARKNIRHYCDGTQKLIGKFPASLLPSNSTEECAGADDLPPPSFAALPYEQFPKNVWFLRENYVLDCDEFLDMVREEYDLILALSITKWVHLNWGDAGLKRFLRRTFLNLRPGGRLLLETQPFASYYKKSKMTPDMFETYKAIEFKPHEFRDFLLSDTVGFSECEELGTPQAISKGFERPILVFKKSAKRKRELPKATNEPTQTEAKHPEAKKIRSADDQKTK
uniref:RNA methyltransferase n=1 Tax=Globodera pallida TaxID=36090 RepID=A0A183CCR1_GLOPA